MSVAEEQFQFVRQLVLERAAIVLADDKKYLVDSRLVPLAHQLGMVDANAVVEHLRTKRDVRLEQRVVEALTTNETSWFRDKRPFDALRLHILPEIIQRNRARRQLRIWSAASSSGQELYSVAILLDEFFPELRRGWQVELVGTDIHSDMVRKAGEGIFSTLEVNRGLPAPLLIRYFQQEGMNWRAKADIRERCRFMQMNLVAPWPVLPTFDLILLRNVLIYFDQQTKRRVLARAAQQLAPDGLLMLGTAETTTGLSDQLEIITAASAVYYRLTRG